MGNQIIQLNLIEMNLVTMPTTVVVDPNSEFVESSLSRPAIAAKTAGPHRYTIMVPHDDEAIVNIGQAAPTRINDTGITGRTKSHVHWHTTADPNKTMVALGGPTNEGWKGFQGINNLSNNAGFMVVTENHSWMEAENQMYFLSRKHDAVLRTAGEGRRVVLQADQGEMDLLAKHKIYATAPTVTIMAPATFEPETGVNYRGHWSADLPQTTAGKTAKSITTIFGILTGCMDLALKIPKLGKSYKAGMNEIETSITDSAKWLLDAWKWGATVNKQFKLFSTDPGPGQLKLGADSDVGVLAGGDVGIWGGDGFSAGGGIFTSISGGISTSVKAVGWSALGGMWTSVKGYRKVEVQAVFGKAVLKGKNEVDVISEDSALKMGGKSSATLMSSEGGVYIGGAKEVHIGAGDGSGFGYLASKASARLGKLSETKDLKKTKLDGTEQLKIDAKAIELKYHDTTIKMQKTQIAMKSKKIELNADNDSVTVRGKKILLE